MHPLLDPAIVRTVEAAATSHRGRPWSVTAFTDLNDRASHPCGILHGEPFSVFVKGGPDRVAFDVELAGLALLARRSGVLTPTTIGSGVVTVSLAEAAPVIGALLLFEALPERAPEDRSAADWAAIGRSLATLHRVKGARFGLETDGYFGPLPLDNRPVPSNRWADFYAQRRLLPYLRTTVDTGQLPSDLARGVERLADRLPDLAGPEPVPTLVHGDAQQNNFVSTPAGAVMVDASPYYGHPEIDLALVDYFRPVPATLFDAYAEVSPIDSGFGERRDLWRLYGYLAVIAVAGHTSFGRVHLRRIADIVHDLG